MVRRLAIFTSLIFAVFATQLPSLVLALSDSQKQVLDSGIYYFNTESTPTTCSSNDGADSVASANNTDYAGRTILNQGELKSLAANMPIYQQAATQAGIPWQALAALHYREHDFSLTEPDNGQGIYQIVDPSKHTDGAYPPSSTVLNQDQFLSQSLDAANFIQKDGAGLDAQSDNSIVKDAFVKYNGEPQKYIDQAVALGFSSSQGYEGSPYVMNIADAPRDPTNGPLNSWLQDFGGGNYRPAQAGQYGAFVVYASVSGLDSSGSSCISGSCNDPSNATQGLSQVRQSVVCIAQQELAKWDSHQLNPGTDFHTYSQNRDEEWCADFVSWVYDQSKYPLASDPNWGISRVEAIKSLGQQNHNFHWHVASGYTPQPGDIAIHNDGTQNYHANIVVGVAGSQVTLIGGNQGSNNYTKSKVSKDVSSVGGGIAGYVSPD